LQAGAWRVILAAMRALICLLALVLAAPASATDWGQYDNARFGYTIDVPPGFEWGREADNGDGRAFRDGASKLLVWGGNITERDFEGEAAAAKGYAAADGWTITYDAATPSWASFSGTQGQRILYQRMVAGCDGHYAAFRLEYSAIEMSALDPVVNRLVQSLKGGC
jgi:hypothetical protein